MWSYISIKFINGCKGQSPGDQWDAQIWKLETSYYPRVIPATSFSGILASLEKSVVDSFVKPDYWPDL